jgi:hypothetical protein
MNKIRMKMKVIYNVSDMLGQRLKRFSFTFRPYWSLAIMGLSEMKANSLRLMVKGRGTMRARKTAISKTRRRKT